VHPSTAQRAQDSGIDTNPSQSELVTNMSDDVYDEWVTQYRLREKVGCTPEQREDLRQPNVN
jgi:hypothetical protein